MKIGIFSTYDDSGAGLASVKINRSLKKYGIDSHLYVGIKKKRESKLLKKSYLYKILFYLRFYLSKIILKFFCYKQTKNGFLSLDLFNLQNFNKINNLNFDLIQINWVNNFLSLDDIYKLNKPLVWRFSDMWPFVGVEHYTDNSKWFRKIILKEKIIDLDYFTWKQKKKLLNKKIHIVTPSKWLARKAKKSYLMKNRNITVIPTPIDPEIYRLEKKKLHYRNIPKNKFIVLFSAKYLYEHRKGFGYFEKITNILNKLYPKKIHFVTIGKFNDKVLNVFPKNTTHFGLVSNESMIVKIYNMSDIFVLLSTKDNLPQTALEAGMCGLPIISLNTGGVKEIIKNNFNGNVLTSINEYKLKKIMENYIDKKNLKNLKIKIRENAKKIYSTDVVMKKYLKLYKIILKKNNKNFKN